MKKLLSASQFILGFCLGLLTMYFAITGKLHTTATAEIFIFSIGFLISTISVAGVYEFLIKKS